MRLALAPIAEAEDLAAAEVEDSAAVEADRDGINSSSPHTVM